MAVVAVVGADAVDGFCFCCLSLLLFLIVYVVVVVVLVGLPYCTVL